METVSPKVVAGQFVYSVKFLCGRIPGGGTNGLAESPAAGFPLSPAFYTTAINIHNPQATAATLTATVTTTFSQNTTITSPPAAFPTSLAADAAHEVDCGDIAQPANPDFVSFAKGFMVIRSNVDLTVVAVYAAKNVRCLVRDNRVRPCI